MRDEAELQFSLEDRAQIDQTLLEGAVNRARSVSFLFSIAFAVYGFTSHNFLIKFIPDLSILDNTWPRILFNTIPYALMGLLFRDPGQNTVLKLWTWTIGMPVVFVAACLIHVWPAMWSGSPQLYLYVHAPNLFVITTSLIVVSPPPKFVIRQIATFFLLFTIPLTVILLRQGESSLLNWAANDFSLLIVVAAYSTIMTHRLRLKVARFDHYMKKTAAPFLGTALTEAIYQQNAELLRDRKAHAVIVKMDIRGYTDFYKNNDPGLVREFMSAYHSIVSRNVGQTNGYWHKSIGDGQLASYGAMESEADLSDIPGIESEMNAANKRRNERQFQNVLAAVATIAFQFERLMERFDVQEKLSLGMAVAAGDVEIRMQGSDTHKMELDIDGEVILRCSRLESYSKTIQGKIGNNSSIVILSPELLTHADDRMFVRWPTTDPELQVRSYPEIKEVAYHSFRDKTERRDRIVKLRAS